MRQFSSSGRERSRPTLDRKGLEALGLRYVGRFATTRSKLSEYLRRKLREADWADAAPPDVADLVDRFAGLGYVDDRAFADAKGAALGRRGFGARRVDAALRAAGVEAVDGADALEAARDGGFAAAVALARRRRIGAFAIEPPDRKAQERAMGILVRAGHDAGVARKIVTGVADDLLDECAGGH